MTPAPAIKSSANDPTVETIDDVIAGYERAAAHHRREAQRLEDLIEGLRETKSQLRGVPS